VAGSKKECIAMAHLKGWPLLLLVAAQLAQFVAARNAGPRESFDLHIPVAPSPVAVEGKVRLLYELHLTNFTDSPLRPIALEIGHGTSGFPLARFEGDALATRIALIGPADEAQLEGTIPAGRRAVLYVELDLAPDAVPAALAHRFSYARADEGEETISGPRIELDATPPPSLGPPVRGGPWVVIYDPSWPRGHRRVFLTVDGRARLPGRFATDWVRVDAQGSSARGDADMARNALGYGEAAIAVADATVVAIRNDFPESERVSTNPKHAIDDASGNHVVLDLGGNRYAIYEHLRPGSVRVAVGQRVQRGQVLGELGFSGDSTGPHLHFHVADGPSPVRAEGRPFALERFRVLGRYEDLSRLGSAPWAPREPAATALRGGELPEGNSVIETAAPAARD
jgi:murein DD-endopeptidase